MVVEVGTGAATATATDMAAADGVAVGGEDNMRNPCTMDITV